MKKVIDYHTYIQDNKHSEIILESFEGDGIQLTLFVKGMSKSIIIDVYDDLMGAYTVAFNNWMTILNAFIVEKIECELKNCFENGMEEI